MYINILSRIGTLHVEWLRSWREFNEELVTSLRNEQLPLEHSWKGDEECTQCRNHVHKNRGCFKQHPELRKKSKARGSKKKSRNAAAAADAD